MTCPNEAHVHPLQRLMFFQGFAVLDEARDLLVLTGDKASAHRIAELVNRHGLTDVPDSPAPLVTWGPPTGRPRKLLAEIQKLPTDPTRQ